MSSQDVQGARDLRKKSTSLTPLEQKLDPVTIAASGAEDSNLDWIDKRVNNDLPEPAPVAGSVNERVAATQFSTREQDLSRRASAAGAKRTGNELDLLGYSGGTRRIGAARRLIGY